MNMLKKKTQWNSGLCWINDENFTPSLWTHQFVRNIKTLKIYLQSLKGQEDSIES